MNSLPQLPFEGGLPVAMTPRSSRRRRAPQQIVIVQPSPQPNKITLDHHLLVQAQWTGKPWKLLLTIIFWLTRSRIVRWLVIGTFGLLSSTTNVADGALTIPDGWSYEILR